MLAKRRIVFTGAVDSPTLMREFQECDLLVLPSLGESAPLVISQAMCLGLPVVATRVGGIPEMVEHGLTGMLVPPGESEPLADALMQLLDDPQLRHRLGAAARGQAVERYLPRSVAQATLRVYQEVSK
jgi:glycosyltransferase involved in cell wall biosynthesis